MNENQYNQLQNNLREMNKAPFDPPQFQDVADYSLTATKGILGGVGSMMVGQSITKTIKIGGTKLKNMAGNAKQAVQDGMTEGEQESQGVLNRLGSRLGQARDAVQERIGQARDFINRRAPARRPQAERDFDEDADPEEGGDTFQRPRPFDQNTNANRQPDSDFENDDEDTDFENDAEEGDEVAGEDIADELGTATVDSTAFDETGVGIGVTAVLGIASVLAGIFIKGHKEGSFTPPPVKVNNFSVQAGV